MTSAADLLLIQPSARPDAAGRGRMAADSANDTSFAELLGAEAPRAEAADIAVDSTPDATPVEAMIVAAPVPPAPVVVPVSDTAAAILAGLTTEGAETIDAGAARPAPALPEFTGADGTDVSQPAAPAAKAETAPASSIQPQTMAAAPAQVSPAPAANIPAANAGAAQAAASMQVAVQDADVTNETNEASAEPAADSTPAANPAATAPSTSPVILTAATQLPTATPAPAIDTLEAPSSAPGAERMAAEAPDASAPRQANTGTSGTAAQTEAARNQAPANRNVQAQASAVEATVNTATDAAPSSAPSAGADITAPRVQVSVDAARPAATHPALQNAPTATIQVYQRMIERVDGRAQRFEVRLDPAELGRVDVRIEIGADKKVHAVLAAHDSAALTDLMRGQRALERALTDAGIDLADGGVRFELSGDGNRGAANNQGQGERNASPDVWRRFSTIDVTADQQTAGAVRAWRPSRFDLVA